MHRLTDFKNFAGAELDLFEPLTILLGRNGSGKTNLIEAIELFAVLARGAPLNEVTDLGRGGVFEVRGGLRACVRFGAETLRLRFNDAIIEVNGQKKPVDYFIELAAHGRHGVRLSAEKLRIGNRTFFAAGSHGGELLDVTYANFSRGANPSRLLSPTHSVLSRYEEIIRESPVDGAKLRAAEGAVGGLRTYLRRSYIFDPQPKSMREYARTVSSLQLWRGGGNLSAVLFALKNGDAESQATLKRITETVRQVPEEPFLGIDFAETSLGDVMMGFLIGDAEDAGGGRLMDARLLSDGTLRMLAVVTALETVPVRSRIVIEEFDSGVHPSRARLLVRTFAEAAERRRLNVLLTTHNPAFMDALDDAQMKNVLLCHHDESRGASCVTRLRDLETAGAPGLHGGLGDFVSSGAIDRYLAPDFAEKRAEAVREWLKSLP